MFAYDFKPRGVCARAIHISLSDDGSTIESVAFDGGCNGNLKAVSRLVACREDRSPPRRQHLWPSGHLLRRSAGGCPAPRPRAGSGCCHGGLSPWLFANLRARPARRAVRSPVGLAPPKRGAPRPGPLTQLHLLRPSIRLLKRALRQRRDLLASGSRALSVQGRRRDSLPSRWGRLSRHVLLARPLPAPLTVARSSKARWGWAGWLRLGR